MADIIRQKGRGLTKTQPEGHMKRKVLTGMGQNPSSGEAVREAIDDAVKNESVPSDIGWGFCFCG